MKNGKQRQIVQYNEEVFLSKEILKNLKMEVVRKVVRPSIMYSSKSWVLKEKLRARINTMDVRFMRRIGDTVK